MRTRLTVNNRIELCNVDDKIIKRIQKAMTLDNPKYTEAVEHGRYTGNLEPKIHLWERIPGGIAFPRGWGMHCMELLSRHGIQPEIYDHKRSLPPIDLSFQGKLRDYQLRAVYDVTQRAFGVLEAATGSGKTVMALAVIAKRLQPALVLVHSKELLHQWVERIKAFLGVEPGLVGDGRLDVRPVSVGIVNTVKKHLDTLPQHFGHIVVDECHRVPSSMFTEAVQAFDSRYMLGLSATAYRRDRLTKLIYMYLGDRTHRVDPELLKAKGSVLAPEVVRRETGFRYSYQDDYPAMMSALTEDESRNRQIAGDVIKQARTGKGTALVVSDRVAHCEALQELIQSSGITTRVLTGQCSKAQREAIVHSVQRGETDVLISTVQLLGEGFDCSGLTSLFLATPIKFKGRLLQVVGRILRPQNGKSPVVFDYIDRQVGVLRAQAKSRGRALSEIAA